MDTISLTPYSTTYSDNSDDLGIVQPQLPELQTVSNTIVYNSTTIQNPNDDVKFANRKSTHATVLQQLQKRTCNSTDSYFSTTLQPTRQLPWCTSTVSDIWHANVIELNIHINAITFLINTNYLRNCVFYNVYQFNDIYLCHLTVGRQPCDPFSNCHRGENMTIQQQIQDLPVPLKMNHDSHYNSNITELEYLTQRLEYLENYKTLYKYSVHSFGNALAINTPNGNIAVQPHAIHNLDITDVIKSLNNSIKTIKSESIELDNENQQLVTHDVNTINIIKGEHSGIMDDATNPIDPGPQVAVTQCTVPRIVDSPEADEFELEEVGPPSIYNESNSWYWSQDEYDDYEDNYSSTPHQSTPSFNRFLPIFEHWPNDQIEEKLDQSDSEDINATNITAATSRGSRVYYSHNNQPTTPIIDQQNGSETVSDNLIPIQPIQPIPKRRTSLDVDPMEIPSLNINDEDYKNVFTFLNDNVESENSDNLTLTESNDTYQNDLDIVYGRIDELFGVNEYSPDLHQQYQQPQQQSPELGNFDEEINDADENEEILFIHSKNAYNKISFVDTNLLFDKLEIGRGKQFISGASGYPPTVSLKTNCIAACRASYASSNVIELDSSNCTSLPEFTTTQLCVIDAVPQTTSVFTLSSHKNNQNKIKNALFSDQFQAYKNVDQSKIQSIETKSIRWWINVPVQLDSGKVIHVQMMADTGANHPCCNSKWAFKYFSKYIDPISKHDTIINTASDKLQPKYALYFLFPTPSGLLLKAKFYLLDNLPVNILADINMLYKFGYEFKQNDKPIKFVHNEEPDPNLHIKTFEDSHKIHSVGNQVTILENINELNESVVIQEQQPMLNKSNQSTVPSILCSTLQEYKFYKLNLDRYNQEYTVNYINDDLSIAQDVWAPVEHEQKEEQLYMFGYSPHNTTREHQQLRKQKQIATLTTPIQNYENFDKYQTKQQITSIVPINQSYKETFELNIITTNKLMDSDVILTQQIALNKYKDLMARKLTSQSLGVQSSVAGSYTYNQIYNAVVNNTPKQAQTFDLTLLNSNDAQQHLGTSLFSRLTSKINKTNKGQIIKNTRKIVTKTSQQHNINFIMMKESFKATQEELIAAALLKSDKKLEHNNLDYLKQVEKLQPGFQGLHDMTVALRDEFNDIFAESTYSRRTMKVEPARLGIIEKFRHITCFRAQYPLSVQKRLWMIEYTKHNDNNHYWHEVTRTLHCIPYLMIPKRNKNGIVIRYRPAFDARVVNQYLELYPIHLPTMRDFDEIYSIKGLFTLMDLKNMFDCIPLHDADKPWSTVMTPMGIRMMDHLAYGFKNCPYYAQNIMNKFAMHTGLTLAYIDDIVMKHHWHWNAQQHINHLKRAFKYFREKNMLLNPSKFFPFVAKCTSFGFERTLHGSSISDAYKQKILKMAKPETKTQLREFQGTLNYVSRYLYNGSMIQYWLNQLLTETPEKRGNLHWNKQAQLAFEQLKFLAANAPVLVNPTIDDEFMVKTDACLTGIGAVLYQNQTNKQTKQKQWVIVDMYHQIMPRDLRKSHSTVHEALAVVQALQHWQKFLLKRKFILYTDNRPVQVVFTEDYEGLNQLTQSQLIRLRIALAPFTFEIKHVKGVNNIIADALSRETLKIIKRLFPHANTPHYKLFNNDKEWLIFGQTIISKDTRYKPKTQQQIDAINEKARQVSKHVNVINQQLNNHNYNHYVNILAHNENIRAQNRFKSQPPVHVPLKHQLIHNEMNSVYNILVSNWKKQQPFCKQQSIDELMKLHAKEAVIIKDEYSTDESINSTVIKQLNHCINLCQKLSLPTLSDLADNQQNTYDMLYKYANVLFQNTVGRKAGCIHDSKCKDCRKIPSYVNLKTHQSLPIHTIMHNKSIQSKNSGLTRRQRRKIKHSILSKSYNYQIMTNNQMKKTKRTLNKDSRKNNQQAKRTNYLNEDFDDLTDKRLIRQEFLYNLYGHRDKSIFESKSFKERQNADTEITLVKSIISRIKSKQCPITRKNIESYEYFTIDKDQKLTQKQQNTNDLIDDYESLLASNMDLAIHIVDGTLDIIDDLLVYKQIINNQKYQSKVVPGILKHKFMDYAHHNIHSHHPNWNQTYNNLKLDYWWPTMKKDIRRFTERCLLCKFANGNIVNRAPLTTRQPVLPRESVFGDFIELKLAGKRVYILVLVDYCTGWTMLIPTKTNDQYTVVDALLRKWIPLHGMFKYFDSDQGSGFIGNVTKLLIQGLDTDLQFAEPGYHRGIGKVERTIKIIQDNFQRINLQWDEVITDCTNPDHLFNILRVIAPHIQAALNQRRPRISTFSPNMLMFGTQLKDLSNIDIVINRMRELFCQKDSSLQNNESSKNGTNTENKNKSNNNKKKSKSKNSGINKNNENDKNEFFDSQKYRTNPLIATTVVTNNNQQNNNEKEKHDKNENSNENEKISFTRQWQINAWKNKKNPKIKTKDRIKYKYEEYIYLNKLLNVFKSIYKVYSNDWHKYMYQTKKYYQTKYNINEVKIARNNKTFIVGTKVLYFVGDKQIANRKWLRRFTGPWTIVVVLSDGTVIIEDTKSKIQKRVSINRLKIFKQNEMNQYSQQFDHHEYDEYSNHLKSILFKVGSTDKEIKSKARGTDLNFRVVRSNNIQSIFQSHSNKVNIRTKNKRVRKILLNMKIERKNRRKQKLKQKSKLKTKIMKSKSNKRNKSKI